MSYKKGDIVVVRFPFILKNGSEVRKGRPALVISDDKAKRRYKDVILSAITSHVPDDVMELEMFIGSKRGTGLLNRALLRLDFIMTVPEEFISRKIGELPHNQLKQAERKLRKLLRINAH